MLLNMRQGMSSGSWCDVQQARQLLLRLRCSWGWKLWCFDHQELHWRRGWQKVGKTKWHTYLFTKFLFSYFIPFIRRAPLTYAIDSQLLSNSPRKEEREEREPITAHQLDLARQIDGVCKKTKTGWLVSSFNSFPRSEAPFKSWWPHQVCCRACSTFAKLLLLSWSQGLVPLHRWVPWQGILNYCLAVHQQWFSYL